MLARIKGKAVLKTKDKILLDVGGLIYEVMLPVIISQRLDELGLDEYVELSVFNYFLNDRSISQPYLIGFLSDLEKEFFELFITVSGIGPKAALKALDRPISTIAEAIENQDLNFLRKLPGIGERRAYEILGRLKGKVSRFMLIPDRGVQEKEEKIKEEIAQEALQILIQLQYKKREAQELIKRSLQANKTIQSTEELLNEIYKQRP